MVPNIYAWFVVIATCCNANIETLKDFVADNDGNDIASSYRNRRSALISHSAIRAGRQAVRTILEGTKQTTDKKYFREFLKPGSFRRAFDDFDSVRPNNVREKMFKNGVLKKTGEVGDRFVTLTSRGPGGRPMLEIVKKVEPGKDMTPAFERITYIE